MGEEALLLRDWVRESVQGWKGRFVRLKIDGDSAGLEVIVPNTMHGSSWVASL